MKNYGGWKVKIEQGRDPFSKERPGDVLIFKFEDGKDCYVDTFVVDALTAKRSRTLNENGPGAPATDYEPLKVNHYEKYFRNRKGDFVPFGVTSQGEVGASAKLFCDKLKKLGALRSATTRKLNLLATANVVVQRSNAAAILERIPRGEAQIADELAEISWRASRDCQGALEKLGFTSPKNSDLPAERNPDSNTPVLKTPITIPYPLNNPPTPSEPLVSQSFVPYSGVQQSIGFISLAQIRGKAAHNTIQNSRPKTESPAKEIERRNPKGGT